MTLIPFEDAEKIGDRFLALLSKCNISPPSRSNLEDELLSLTQVVEAAKKPSLASGPNRASILRMAAGIHDLAAKVLTVEPLPDFASFIEHLRLIGEAKYPSASLSQNAYSNDDTARKMAELYIGCLAAHVGTNVVLDSPTNALGDNPDVMLTLEPVFDSGGVEAPQRWAFAIKTITSRSGQTIFERIREGAEQIDSPRCEATRGMVIINTKGSLDHDALFGATYADLPSAIEALDAQVEQLITLAEENRPQTEWDDLFENKVVRPILFMAQSLVIMPTPAGPTPTALKMLKAYGANGTLDQVGATLARDMNEFMQNVLLGIPGCDGQFPR